MDKTRFLPDSRLRQLRETFKQKLKDFHIWTHFGFWCHVFVCLDNQRAVEITESDGVSSDQEQDVEMNEVEGNINARRTLLR